MSSRNLRPPLNGILGMTRLALARVGVEGELKQSLQTIEKSGTTLRKLIDLLDIGRIEAGQLSATREVFSVELLNEVVSLVRPLAAEHSTSIEVGIDDHVPDLVEAELAHLRQVLLNLLGNAVKFTTEGSISIAVSSQDEEMDGLELRFAVSDTGIGIPANQVNKIFEPLTQASNTIAGPYGGSGLGLAIAKRLVETMGGFISVRSELHRGSTFTFNVVVKPVTAIGEAIRSPDPQGAIAPLRLLLVEDDAINQQVATGLLELEGHQVTLARTGAEAIAITTQRTFDAILMDMRLPDMTGLAAIEAIRACQAAPIIAVTANVMPEDVQRYIAGGTAAVVAKPIDPEKLHSALGRLAHRPRTGMPKEPLHFPAAFDAEQIGVLLASFPPYRTIALLQELDCSIAESVQVIEDALVGGCADSIVKRAHRLAGTAAAFALKNLHSASASLEAAASNRHDDVLISRAASHALSEARQAMTAIAALSDAIRTNSLKAPE